jgi:beta-lactamase superfamily II metal-dependent hydrolase
MYEFDFLAVGEGERSGDAIAVRFTVPNGDEPVVGVIDAGFKQNGDELVEHVNRYYGTGTLDFALLTHPDLDHVGGMGQVVRGLNVRCLLLHRPALHGHALNSGAEPTEELAALVEEKGGTVVEPFAGVSAWDDNFFIAGPTEAFYEEMLEQQEAASKEAAAGRGVVLAERLGKTRIAKAIATKLASFPVEIPFGDAGGDNPRNNSSAILSLMIDGRHSLFMGDAGVPAIDEALDSLEALGHTVGQWPRLVVLPHHGSRHNLDLATINRLLGGHMDDQSFGTAVASVSAESDNPSPRVTNAVGRRGYAVKRTAGMSFRHHHDAPERPRLGRSGSYTSPSRRNRPRRRLMLDAYSLQARRVPVAAVVLPPLVLAGTSALASVKLGIVSGLVLTVCAALAGQLGRDRGKRLEPQLWGELGRQPDTPTPPILYCGQPGCRRAASRTHRDDHRRAPANLARGARRSDRCRRPLRGGVGAHPSAYAQSGRVLAVARRERQLRDASQHARTEARRGRRLRPHHRCRRASAVA